MVNYYLYYGVGTAIKNKEDLYVLKWEESQDILSVKKASWKPYYIGNFDR